MTSEFALIARHFTRPGRSAILGIGDDAALLAPTAGMQLAVSVDALVAGRHFLPSVAPERLGHKALAVNLSDLAAMGAVPRWALLAITLPAADEAWLAGFTRGFFRLAEQHRVELVGGDTTRGPLNIGITVLGEVEAGRALRRDGARPGDDIWVSGQLGGAALGLRHARGELSLAGADAAACRDRLDLPEPRLALGRLLGDGLAHAAIDVSDGLLADLGHILDRSGVGATVDYSAVPLEPALAGNPGLIAACALHGGDDYELCFTAPPGQAGAVCAAGARAGVPVTRIGRITAEPGLRLQDAAGRAVTVPCGGYDHFGDDGEG
jgi:thiamine-monophosphate kinase